MTIATHDGSVKQTLDWLESVLDAMLNGEKPLVDPENPTQSFLIDQMKIMFDQGHLSEPYESYMTLPHELELPEARQAEIMKYKGVTIREPLHKNITTEGRSLRSTLENWGVKNARVLGEDPAFLYRKHVDEQLTQADAFVLTQSGIAGLYQYVRYLNLTLDQAQPNPKALFVLQNSEGYWSPFLSYFKFLIDQTNNFKITNSRHDTSVYLNDTMSSEDKARAVGFDPSTKVPGPGHQILFMSTNPKKTRDYRRAAMERHDGVRVKDFFSIMSTHPKGADELSYSYAGNVLEKFECLVSLFIQSGTDNVRKQLQDSGFPVSKVSIMLEDQGAELDGELFNGPEFENCAKGRNNPYRSSGPGPELKGISSAVASEPFNGHTGDRAFVERVFAANERLYGDDAKPKIPAREISCALVVRVDELLECIDNAIHKNYDDDADLEIDSSLIFQNVLEDNLFDIVEAEVRNDLQRTPNKAGNALELKNFLIPEKSTKKDIQDDIPNYQSMFGIPANIYKTIARVRGFADRQSLENRVSLEFEAANLPQKRIEPFNFPEPLTEHSYQIDTTDGEVLEFKSALRCFHEYCLEQDAFVFKESDKKQDFWKDLFKSTSLLVGKQLKDPSVSGDPFVMVTGRIHSILQRFSKWLIPTPLEALCEVVDDEEQVDEALISQFVELDPCQPETHKMQKSGVEADESFFRVTVYCSAGSTDKDLQEQSRELGFDLGNLGFAVKTGGGTGPDGLMVQVNEGVQDTKKGFVPYLRKQIDIDPATYPKTHLACHHSIQTSEEEGLYDRSDYYDVCPDIYLRMDKLQQTDAEIVFPGGAGTFQEAAYSAIKRQAALSDVANRPMIIVNHNGIYDEFISEIPEKDFDALNIKIAENKNQALEMVIEARRMKGMEPDLPYKNLQEYRNIRDKYRQNIGWNPANDICIIPSSKIA